MYTWGGLGLDTGPLQHVPLASQALIKGFFTHPAAALLSGLEGALYPPLGLYWDGVLSRGRSQAGYPPYQACWPEG